MATHDRLRVLVVHNRYQQRGGEDVVFESEAALLAEAGHAVRTLVLDNSSIRARESVGDRIRLAADTVWSRRSARIVTRAVRDFRPDVMHAHNTFPLWSPSIFRAAARQGVATVATLHNYRLVCPSANLYRDGGPCMDCVGRTIAWPSVVHRCYRGSRLQTAVVAGMLAANRLNRTFDIDIHAYIALTPFVRARLVAGGLPPELVHVKPNFVSPDPGASAEPRSGFLFAGRLTEEKGIRLLIEAAQQMKATGIEIRVAGTGPLEEELRAVARQAPELHPLGEIPRQQLFGELRRSIAAVVPARWYEPFGLIVAEAYATGTAVVAASIGGLADLVSAETGLLLRDGTVEDLVSALVWADGHRPEMAQLGSNARAVFEARYSATSNLEQLLGIYEQAISTAHAQFRSDRGYRP
jgi:glycosyltransferase involved in cell wall biosynthesis